VFTTKKYGPKDFIRYEWLTGKGFCGYRSVTVALREDEVIGTGCFYSGKGYPALLRATMWNIVRFYGTPNSLRVLSRSRHTGSVIKRPRKDELYLSNLGVSERARSQGIGSKLIQHHLAKAKDRGYTLFSLDVADNNPQAESLYTRLGLSVIEEKIFSKKDAGIPNIRKMELRL